MVIHIYYFGALELGLKRTYLRGHDFFCIFAN